MTESDDPTARPLANVEKTVGWLLSHLSGDELAHFESELPTWGANNQNDLSLDEVDAAVHDLDRWLRWWIQQVRK